MRGPAVERSRHAGFPRGRLVPLAERARAVAVEPQHLRQRRDAVRIASRVAGKCGRGLHDGAGVHRMVISPGLERVARRRAQRGRMEVVEPQAALRQQIHRRRPDGSAERAGSAETDVVDQHDDDVGRLGGRLHFKARRRLRISRVELGVPLGRRFCDRQNRAVRLRRGRRRPGCLLRRRWAAARKDEPGEGGGNTTKYSSSHVSHSQGRQGKHLLKSYARNGECRRDH